MFVPLHVYLSCHTVGFPRDMGALITVTFNHMQVNRVHLVSVGKTAKPWCGICKLCEIWYMLFYSCKCLICCALSLVCVCSVRGNSLVLFIFTIFDVWTLFCMLRDMFV